MAGFPDKDQPGQDIASRQVRRPRPPMASSRSASAVGDNLLRPTAKGQPDPPLVLATGDAIALEVFDTNDQSSSSSSGSPDWAGSKVWASGGDRPAFFSQELTVLRATPKTQVRPRREGRSW